jgi:NADPH-dependent curcumin reductase CurA
VSRLVAARARLAGRHRPTVVAIARAARIEGGMLEHIVLAARPEGEPGPEHFRLEALRLPDPAEGEVLTRTLWLSLDPYMRGRMNAGRSYAAPVEVGATMVGQVVAEVIASRDPRFAPGDLVVAPSGWATHGVAPGAALTRIPPGVSPQAALSVLGMPGMTAWVGLTRIARAEAGETVIVSAATGAVGSVACQLARARGLRVIGIAGGPEKCRIAVEDFGCDACLDHRGASARDLGRAIGAAAPGGAQVYFDNVGGRVLEAVLPNMADFGRIALCGTIAWYSGNEGGPTAAALWRGILTMRLTVQGFIVTDHWDHFPAFLAEVAPMVADGRLRWRETVAEGLRAAPQAFLAMLKGGNLGKQLVRVA